MTQGTKKGAGADRGRPQACTWPRTRLKFVAQVQGGLALGKNYGPTSLVEYPYLRVANVQDGYLDLAEVATVFVPETEAARSLLAVGDVLMNEGGDADKLGRGCVWQGQIRPCLHQNHVFAVRPRGIAPEWLSAWTSGPQAKAYFESRAKQATNLASISATNIREMPISVPPLPIQRAIAAYLDCETAQIDALVAAKERWVELLAEKRRALITRAVTCGLDPDVPLRDSSIPWLGEIPAHWQSRRLKFVSPEITVGIVVTPAKYYEPSGVPCLRSPNVRETGLSDADLVFISQESNMLHQKSRIFAGDVVAVRSGQPGTASVVDGRFDGANCIDLIIIRRSTQMASEFLAYFLNSAPARMQFLSGGGGAIQQHFNIGEALDLTVPLPPLGEQRAIVAHIAAETAKLDALRAGAERTIALLTERRAALIAAAVTGHVELLEAIT